MFSTFFSNFSSLIFYHLFYLCLTFWLVLPFCWYFWASFTSDVWHNFLVHRKFHGPGAPSLEQAIWPDASKIIGIITFWFPRCNAAAQWCCICEGVVYMPETLVCTSFLCLYSLGKLAAIQEAIQVKIIKFLPHRGYGWTWKSFSPFWFSEERSSSSGEFKHDCVVPMAMAVFSDSLRRLRRLCVYQVAIATKHQQMSCDVVHSHFQTSLSSENCKRARAALAILFWSWCVRPMEWLVNLK